MTSKNKEIIEAEKLDEQYKVTWKKIEKEFAGEYLQRQDDGENLANYLIAPLHELRVELMARYAKHQVPTLVARRRAPHALLDLYYLLQQPPKNCGIFWDIEVPLLTKVCQINLASSESLHKIIWHFDSQSRRHYFPMIDWLPTLMQDYPTAHLEAYLEGFQLARESQYRKNWEEIEEVCGIAQRFMDAIESGTTLERIDLLKLHLHVKKVRILDILPPLGSTVILPDKVELTDLVELSFFPGNLISVFIADNLLELLLREKARRQQGLNSNVIRCEVCSCLFERTTGKQKYCSERHSNLANVRRWNARHKVYL